LFRALKQVVAKTTFNQFVADVVTLWSGMAFVIKAAKLFY